jgi:hypothetical protein
MDACLNWCSKWSRSPMAVTAPNVSRKASSRRGIRGTSCARTSSRRPLRSFLIGPALNEFASTLSATKSCWWHEDPSRRFRRTPRCPVVPKMAVREGSPSRQSYHPGNVQADSPPARDTGPPSAPTGNVEFHPSRCRSAQGCPARRDPRGLVDDQGSSADISLHIPKAGQTEPHLFLG